MIRNMKKNKDNGINERKNIANITRRVIEGKAISIILVIGKNGPNPDSIITLWLIHSL